MKTKLVGIFVCMLLISTTVLSVAENVKIESTTENQDTTSGSSSFGMPYFYEQLSEEIWNNKLGKTSDRAYRDWITKAQQTTDGGYMAIGVTETYGAGSMDVWLVKTDSNGNEQWNKTWGGPYMDVAFGGQQTSDDGYVIAGGTYGAAALDLWLIKTDSNGTEQWNKKFGSDIPWNDYAMFVQQTSDDGYIIFGNTPSYGAGSWDFWLIKTDSNGTEQWNKTFGGSFADYGFVARQIDDGYIVIGSTDSFGTIGVHDVWLIKTDSNGNELLNKTFGGTSNDIGHDVWQTTDGGYIILGYTSSFGDGDRDFWLIKTDVNGNEQWNKTYDGADCYTWIEIVGYSSGMSVRQLSDGYILLGTTDAPYGDGPLCIKMIETDNYGNENWNKTFGGSFYDEGYWINETSDDGYIISGSTMSYETSTVDGWLIKTDRNGNKQWDKIFPADQPPNTPSNPEPEDGEVDVSIYIDLSWHCTDPEYDPLKYDVYFGTTSPPPKVVSKQPGKKYDPGILDFDTEYYWRIVAWDSPGGLSTSGPIWSFTTEENLLHEGKVTFEGFEQDKMPPYGWQNLTYSNDTWDIGEGDFYAHSGNYGAVCHSGTAGNPQDEWLVSHTLDFSTMNNIVLSFWWKSDYTKMVELDNFDVFIEVSLDNGSSWDTIWTSGDIGIFTSWEWYNTSLGVPISLDDYEGESNVQIAWHFLGEDTADFIIDEIFIVGIKKIPVLNLINIKGGIGKITGELENSEDVMVNNISWKMEVVLPEVGPLRQLFRGLLFSPQQKEWETTNNKFSMSMFGLGRAIGNISFKYTAYDFDLPGHGVDVESVREVNILGLFIFLGVDIIPQPTRTWVKIDPENVTYQQNQSDPYAKSVRLHFEKLQYHNVRVHDSDSSDILFQGACCFDGESGTLKEGFITKGIVTSENAYWEIELVNGE